jgi:predicted branched-subunit amino acid permease
MFIVLLVMQISSRVEVITAAAAGILSLVFALTIDGSWNIILATVAAAFLGVYLDGE